MLNHYQFLMDIGLLIFQIDDQLMAMEVVD